MRLSICQDLSRYTNASINTCPLIMRVFILCPLWRQLRSPFSVHSHVGELWLGDRRRGGDGGGCHRYLAGEPRDQLMVLSIVMVVLQVTRFVGACWCWSSFTVGGKRGDDKNITKAIANNHSSKYQERRWLSCFL